MQGIAEKEAFPYFWISMKMKQLLTLICILFALSGTAQKDYFSDPVRIPIRISGSFAELRSDHFHSGIDIKTQGQTGIPVYAAAEGYIARIVVSPGGYGKALYINHPNGTTTVYGHLDRFRPDIDKYVKEKQYEQRKFKVGLFPKKNLFRVSKEDLIAWSGNSGSSGGPHLHFEVRDTKSSHPLNPLQFNFSVEDKLPPRIFSLMVTPLTEISRVDRSPAKQFFPVEKNGKHFQIKGVPLIEASGEIGFAVKANDYFNDSWNKCGINEIELNIDGELFFTYSIHEFSFSNSRYLNSQIDYEEYINNRNRYLKTWIDPGNMLPAYPFVKEKGSFTPEPDRVYTIKLILKDSYKNASVLEFDLLGKFPEQSQLPEKQIPSKFDYTKANTFKNEFLQVHIPRKALYKTINFKYNSIPVAPDLYSETHAIHLDTEPLHRSATLKIKASYLPIGLESKSLIVRVDPETGDISSAGGKLQYGWVETKIASFGHYAVAVDTLAPDVQALDFSEGSNLENKKDISLVIEDDLSGIGSFEAFLNDSWILMEYDPKNKRITHQFDESRIQLNRNHHLKVIVKDNKNNTQIYESSFWR